LSKKCSSHGELAFSLQWPAAPNVYDSSGLHRDESQKHEKAGERGQNDPRKIHVVDLVTHGHFQLALKKHYEREVEQEQITLGYPQYEQRCQRRERNGLAAGSPE
jgi:hypothetical protein